MIQPILGRPLIAPSTSGTRYFGLCFNGVTATQNDSVNYIPAAGVFSNAYIALSAAPGAGKSYTFTLQKNGVDTSVVVTISDAATSGQDITHSVTFAAGDHATWKCVPSGTPGAANVIQFYVEFNSTTGNTCIFTEGLFPYSTLTPARFSGFSTSGRVTGAGNQVQVTVAVAGVISGMYAYYNNGGGVASSSWDFFVYKNGTKQDGTGGTVNTQTNLSTVSGGLQVGSASFSLPVSPGDVIYLEAIRNGSTPNGTGGVSISFVATNSNEIPFSGTMGQLTSATATTEYTPFVPMTSGQGTSASALNSIVPLRKLELSKLYVTLVTAPGAVGRQRVFTVFKNGSSTALTCTATNTDTTKNDLTNKVKYSPGDTLAFNDVTTGNPTLAASYTSYGLVLALSIGSGAGNNAQGNKKGGGGAVNNMNPGGASAIGLGNMGVNIGSLS